MLKVTHSRHDHSRIRLSGFSELGVPVFLGHNMQFFGETTFQKVVLIVGHKKLF